MLKTCKYFFKDWKFNCFALFSVIACTIIGLILRYVPETWLQWIMNKTIGRNKSAI